MKLYTGRPANRLALTLQHWVRDTPNGPLRQQFPAHAHAETVRLYGVTLFGWFIGVQRYKSREHKNTDMVES